MQVVAVQVHVIHQCCPWIAAGFGGASAPDISARRTPRIVTQFCVSSHISSSFPPSRCFICLLKLSWTYYLTSLYLLWLLYISFAGSGRLQSNVMNKPSFTRPRSTAVIPPQTPAIFLRFVANIHRTRCWVWCRTTGGAFVSPFNNRLGQRKGLTM